MGTTLHYGGMIGSLELEWFWDSLTDEERKTITSYSLDSSNSLPDQGKIGRTSASQLIYLVTFLIYASSRRQYDIAETLIRLCENAKGTDLDFHYFYINAGDCYYNQIRRGKVLLILQYTTMSLTWIYSLDIKMNYMHCFADRRHIYYLSKGLPHVMKYKAELKMLLLSANKP